ncbi:hypothetical protein MUB24_10875 [Lederbergia sp. NSJ-179]|uniref:hypothetical protein n=1 Tax=Lederbergia sp. NSJ-179 TaxID=2931402 RepID=UPI001FD272C6|nr:hypothetical protein [Lederbergia sp. NSJ-179]MCJ7841391.1 hypothetical protein [Lederbergia sp. NSJ-179]
MGFYKKFNILLNSGKNEETLKFLREFKNSRTLTVNEMGWMYWNTSDILAIMRNPLLVYENHIEFVEWGKIALLPDKLHWFVSDTTQALTLSLGEYFDEWFDWYLYACKHSSRNKENRGIRFESHRAAIASLLKLEKFSQIEVPFRNLLELIEEDKNWENNIFAEFTYYTLLLEKAFIFDQQELVNDVIKNINYLTDQKVKKKVLCSNVVEKQDNVALGSWEDLNSSRLTKDSMNVLLHNIGCTFNEVGKYEESIKMFQLALHNGVKISKYGLSLYLSSIWKTGENSEEVVKAFNEFSSEGLTVNEMFQFAPELRNVDWSC